MRIGVNTFIWAAEFGRPLDLLPCLEDAGFDGLEIPLFEPTSFSAAEVRRVLGPNLGAPSAAVAIRRDIEPDVDAIAFDGLAFPRKALDS